VKIIVRKFQSNNLVKNLEVYLHMLYLLMLEQEQLITQRFLLKIKMIYI